MVFQNTPNTEAPRGDEHLHPRHEGAVDGGERHRHAAQHLHAARRAGARSRCAGRNTSARRFTASARRPRSCSPRTIGRAGATSASRKSARPARPLRPHEQPGSAPRQPGRDHQRDPQCLRAAERPAGEMVLPRLSRLGAAQQPRRGPALPRLLGLQPDDPDPALAGRLRAALCRDDGRRRQDHGARPGAARRGQIPARHRRS